MSQTSVTIKRRLRTLLGSEESLETVGTSVPCVAPQTEETCALVLATAAEEGWTVRIVGSRGFHPVDIPADLILSTTALAELPEIRPADLVATVGAGVVLEDLCQQLGNLGVWLPIDPPGERRTLGSIIATATAGPLRSGYGSVRDHVLGLTLVTGQGRIVRFGGRMVKNVAGFDLTKMATGSFGGFGVVTSAHLRLRATPHTDLTLTALGSRSELLQQARAILTHGLSPASLEVISPAAAGEDQWLLAVRLTGSDTSVSAERDAVSAASTLSFTTKSAAEASHFWRSVSTGTTNFPTSLRIGTLIAALDGTVDLVTHHIGEEHMSISVAAATVRWSGSVTSDKLQRLRHAAVQQEMPLTLERAPWPVLSTLGHFGVYREGVSSLVRGLRQTFDPTGVLVVPLGDEA
jgi:glycolate oxidase FAD binding subunit